MKNYLPIILLLISISAFAQQNNPVKDAAEKMQRGDFPGAASLLDAAIEKNQTYTAAYELRYVLRSITGNIKGSIEDLSKLIELRPATGKYYYERARYRMLTQDFQGALTDYDAAIIKGVPADRVYTDRAGLKRILKDIDGAIKDYQLAISIRPHSVAANLGYAEILIEKDDKTGAIKYLEEFLKRIEDDWDNEFPTTKVKPFNQTTLVTTPPLNGSSIVATGQAVLIKGNTPKTREEGERQAAQTEQLLTLTTAYSELASLYEEQNDLPKAVININKAFSLEQGGRSYHLYDTRGRIRLKLKDYDGAISDLTIAARGMPFDATIFLNRGIAYYLSGKENDAQKDFDTYLQKFPNGKEILDRRLEEAKMRKAESK